MKTFDELECHICRGKFQVSLTNMDIDIDMIESYTCFGCSPEEQRLYEEKRQKRMYDALREGGLTWKK